ncbi:hypothetical protein JKP88DRAFT_335741 [Tribonema minus]|uniref:Uncharacterized protein n=1 Tax=Tribonema minus TaxID=303371 RepID=A0A835YJ94_9STRA|nr:hypothetical protein JKP88DRAFT_335741 [Tribonema minus]
MTYREGICMANRPLEKTTREKDCRREVLHRFDLSNKDSRVKKAGRGELDCVALGLSLDMEEFKFAFDTGTVTVVWNERCDPGVFYLDVALSTQVPDNSPAQGILAVRTALTALPCAPGSGIDNCVWVAEVETKLPEEYDGPDAGVGRRQLQQPHFNATGLQGLNADIALLAAVHGGDSGARAHFRRNGGRRLAAEGAVMMPSGRRLDDGTKVRVLWAYNNVVKNMTESAIASMVAAGVASANQALSNSHAGFQIELAGLMRSTYNDVDQGSIIANLRDGVIADVKQKREEVAADLVQWISHDKKYCGYGFVLYNLTTADSKRGVSSVLFTCFAGYSQIHEIGHNMGCDHDSANVGGDHTSSQWASYAYGYRRCGGGSTSAPYFRTVMAYTCSRAPRVAYFSSPDVKYSSTAVGTSTANNAKPHSNPHYKSANAKAHNFNTNVKTYDSDSDSEADDSCADGHANGRTDWRSDAAADRCYFNTNFNTDFNTNLTANCCAQCTANFNAQRGAYVSTQRDSDPDSNARADLESHGTADHRAALREAHAPAYNFKTDSAADLHAHSRPHSPAYFNSYINTYGAAIGSAYACAVCSSHDAAADFAAHDEAANSRSHYTSVLTIAASAYDYTTGSGAGTVKLKFYTSEGKVVPGTTTTLLSFATTKSLMTYAEKLVATGDMNIEYLKLTVVKPL